MYQRRTIDRSLRKSKLEELAESEGLSVDEMFESYGADSVVPGICTNEGCSFTAEYEPDQDEGWCDQCQTTTVASALVLSGVL
jgi:hypothetical protein